MALTKSLSEPAGDDHVSVFMRCMKQSAVEDFRFPQLTRRMSEIKDTEGGLSAMCKSIEELVLKGFAEGRQEGWQKGWQEGENVVFSLIADGDISLERGAEKLGLAPEQMRTAMAERGFALP